MTSPPPTAGAGPAAKSAARSGRSLGSRLRRAFWTSLVLGVLLAAAYIWAMLRFSYSDGERAGYVQKFSRKGWVCKTWEGELAMATLPGALPEVFPFTAWDDSVAAQLNRLMGQRVVLHYKEKVGLPTSCFGETRHIVDEVRPVPAP
jgi:hypothetical protein